MKWKNLNIFSLKKYWFRKQFSKNMTNNTFHAISYNNNRLKQQTKKKEMPITYLVSLEASQAISSRRTLSNQNDIHQISNNMKDDAPMH